MSKIAASALYETYAVVSSDTTLLPANRILSAAQRANYDVLSVIFTMVSADWKTAAQTLGSVCRLWRYIALSTPQIWTRINLGTSIKPSHLRIILDRSKPLPLHVFIPCSVSNKKLKTLSSATDRIFCMEITNHFRFLRHQFPVLERLDLGLTRKADDRQYRFKVPQFPQLRELHLIRVQDNTLYHVSPRQTRFAVLQKLEISCRSPFSDWEIMVQEVASTLVSLSLLVSYSSDERHRTTFSLPHLRHLQITQNDNEGWLMVDLDSPRLESVDDASGIGKGAVIRLRTPTSVKQLHTGVFPLDLSPYPELRQLWIHGDGRYNQIIPSFISQLTSCPQLEAIFYHHPRRMVMEDEAQHLYQPPGSVFSAILDLVRESGRDITVREFLPNEVDLPGAMPRCAIRAIENNA